MNRTIRLPGILEMPAERQTKPPLEHAELRLQPKGRVRIGAGREAGGRAEIPNIQSDDLVRVEYSNGFKLWMRADEAFAEWGRQPVRGAPAEESDVWDLVPRIRRADRERGIGGVVIQALEFFGIDLAGKVAKELAGWWERKRLHGNDPGIYRCSLAPVFQLERLEGNIPFAESDPATGKPRPILLFVHGTLSSAQGGFGKLWAPDNTHGAAALRDLNKRYDGRAYAFEHLTTTVSPIDNALQLAQRLPAGAVVHLVGHSRGGLIGELLALGQRDRSSDPLTEEFLDQIFDESRNRGVEEEVGQRELVTKGYAGERAQLKKLLAVLEQKQLQITRFVRVACPARGTTLASGRLDRWLSVFNYLAAESPVDEAADFLLAVVKERTDPRTLPGLEAQMPQSALVQLLNHVDLRVDADLSVISGDVEGDSLWFRLKWLIADWFYDSDHDLVVNTGSMYGGAKRPAGQARFLFDQGKSVNHFNYFLNAKTVQAMLDGLTRADGVLGGFQPLDEARHEEPAWRAAVARSGTLGPRPVAFVLPGTMGSQLTVNADRIWLDYLDLAHGRLFELDMAARGVLPLDVVANFYGDFLEYLSRSHEVVPFPYDWRKSLLGSADLLAEKVREKLAACEKNQKPLHLVAHSMGGLVARAMIARHPEIWSRIQALPGSRFLMLGTPNAGSYEAIRWLTGWNSTLGKLALLDISHNTRDIVGLVGRFQGLLELLPSSPGNRNFADPGLWQSLCGWVSNWPVPLEQDLQQAAKTWGVVRASPIDPERMLYVAGWAEETACDYEEPSSRGLFGVEKPPLRFYATRQGDGTVTWEAGLLPRVKTWYLQDANHGELLSHEDAFPAYLELLTTGGTTRLPDTPPAVSRAAPGEERILMSLEMPDSIPSERDLSGFVFGAGKPPKTRRKRRLPRVKVSICHGDLAYARYPVCVGHYQGDTIVSAEAALNAQLDGALLRRAQFGLYPGEAGTHEVFIHRRSGAKPGGAIVVGLGRVGELTPGALESGVAGALLEYALTIVDWPDERFGAKDSLRSASLSCLLIGTGAGGMTVRDSMVSILRAVMAANQRLADTRFDDKVLIDEIQFLELFEDISIQAARKLDIILRDGELAEHFEWAERVVQEGQGGRRRVLFEEAPNWWHRLEIIHDRKRDELRFIALTDRARAEESLVSGQMRLADDFIRVAQESSGDGEEVSRTLFEMLIPNRVKELAPNQYNVVLVVDEVSARYPWELLSNRWSRPEPLAVAAGMLRQLKTPTYRARPAHSFLKTAYVVGNPKLATDAGVSVFADLPGAAKEAEEVAALLRSQGYRVNERRVALDAREILVGLHRDAYRVLHLAGHGVHDYAVEQGVAPAAACGACDQPLPTTQKLVSGMVIGPDVFLTPGDVEQMRWVPELVFINCCYLGSTTTLAPEWTRYNRLAANLATQFINMGVKAVIAAGWAVDDGAALDFAREFYGRFLGGESFGEAVRAARKEALLKHPHANTWGAYQCYGDPAFRLGGNGGAGGLPTGRIYHSARELVAELENRASDIRMRPASAPDGATANEIVQEILEPIPEAQLDAWMSRGDVSAALGVVYGELGDFHQAIQHLNRAIQADKANFPVRALEQHANFAVKGAWQRWRSASREDEGARRAAVAQIEAAIGQVAALSQMAPTPERLCVQGSAYKRLAWMQQGEEALAALVNMAVSYRTAFELGSRKADDKDRVDPYPLTNWLDAEAILVWVGGGRDAGWKNQMHEWCAIAIEEAKSRERIEPSFRNSAVEPDCRLTLGLAEASFDQDDIARIVEGYGQAFRRGGSPRDRNTVLEQIDFLMEMAERGGKPAVHEALRQIRDALG